MLFRDGLPGSATRLQNHEDIRGRMRAARRQAVAVGGRTSLPWRLSRSVIDSVGLAGAEFALPIRSAWRFATCRGGRNADNPLLDADGLSRDRPSPVLVVRRLAVSTDPRERARLAGGNRCEDDDGEGAAERRMGSWE